jgi:hypothetical protein
VRRACGGVAGTGADVGLRAGEVRLIVLPEAGLTGAGRSPEAGGDSGSDFLVRSTGK